MNKGLRPPAAQGLGMQACRDVEIWRYRKVEEEDVKYVNRKLTTKNKLISSIPLSLYPSVPIPFSA
jgi:hypothetical protein